MSQDHKDGRESLSFTGRDGRGKRINWVPDTQTKWEAGLIEGRRRLSEVRRLALRRPAEARAAILEAITAPTWGAQARGASAAEHGFAEALAHAAVAHLCRPSPPRREHAQTFICLRLKGVYS